MENQELTHHGILGMKWGVRRYQNKDGSLTKAGKRRLRDEEPKEKTTKEMTDSELRERINRMELEKRYADLSRTEEEKSISKGKAFVGRILEKSGENLLTQVVNHYGAKLANNLIGETAIVKDEVTGEFKEVIKEVIFANNKKKS